MLRFIIFLYCLLIFFTISFGIPVKAAILENSASYSSFLLTQPAKNIYFDNITANSFRIRWTNGNGTKRVVFVKQTNSLSEVPTPLNNTTYAARTVFGDPTSGQLPTGWFCVYNNNSNFVTVTGLNTTTNNYRVVIFEYDGAPGAEQYNLTLDTGNPVTTAPLVEASDVSVNNIQNSQAQISWTRGNGSSCAVFIRATTSGTPNPVSNTDYNANSVFGSGSQAGSGWFCIYKGTETSVTVSNLTSKSNYRVMVVELNGDNFFEQYSRSTNLTNPVNFTTRPNPCLNVSFSNVLATSMTVSWTNGNGNGRTVFIKETTTNELAAPENMTTYDPSTNFGMGSEIGGTGWYCISRGTSSSVNVYGLTPGKTYRVMACEYTGALGSEVYNIFEAYANPNSCRNSFQASNIVYSNVQTTSIDISWKRGSEDSCAVFMKQATTGNAAPVNGTIYVDNPTFGSGDQIGNTGWYCVYLGKGNSATVNVANSDIPYQIMVCEFSEIAGQRLYNNAVATGNPLNKPAAPVTPSNQATNLSFSNLLATSATIGWSNGNGSKRAVFIKQTTGSETALPDANTTYEANSTFRNGSQIEATGWYCIYNGTGTSVNIFGLAPGNSYRIMVCEYNGIDGMEQYNINAVTTNPLSLHTILQASNVSFNNILPASMDISWSRGNGDSCIVFVKKTTSGNAFPEDGTNYLANGSFESGSQIETTGWFCVYKGKGNSVNVNGLNTTLSYRVMVCEYTNSGGPVKYVLSGSIGNPANIPLPSTPTIQSKEIVFKNIASNYLTVSWTNGNGGNRAVFMKETTDIDSPIPFDETYSGNSTFGNGTQIGTSEWYCIYNGTGTSVNVYGLKAGSTYRAMICDYNGIPGFEEYNTSTASNNPASVQLLLQASNIVVSNIQPTSFDLEWSRGNGDSCAVFIKQATSGNAIPANGIIYIPNSTFGAGTQIGVTGWHCVYTGVGNSTTINFGTTDNAYQIMVCEFTGSGTNNMYNTSTALNNPVNKPAVPVSPMPVRPTSQANTITFSNTLASSVTLNWNKGNGANRIVFMKETSAFDRASPVDFDSYNADVFGAGDQIGSTGWFCVAKGNISNTTVTGLNSGSTYTAMVCEYNGSDGNEIYNTDFASGNPAAVLLTLQSTSINFSNVQPTSMDVSWTRGNGSACIVFARQGNSGNVRLTNTITYNAGNMFGEGTPDGTGWFCIYKGTGTDVSVTGLTPNLDYRIMVCEYNGVSGTEMYNPSAASGNPANKPGTPVNQAYNINFSNVTTNAMNVSWSNGNGSRRIVFIKETDGLDHSEPINNTTYSANTIYGSGSQIGSTGWFCIANGTMNNVTVTGLSAGKTYRVMVCEYNGIPGNELYNKNFNTNNPNSVQLTVQSSNIVFNNVQPTSTEISWTRGSGTGCVVFMKQANSGSVTLANTISYQAGNTFGAGSPDGTGWFCVYNGTENSTTVNGLLANKDYRVMVCEYTGSTGNEQYNISTASGNPVNKPLVPVNQASNINFTSITNNSMSISWTNGNGSKRAVFVKETSAVESPLPELNQTYSPDIAFGSGDQIGTTGWFCVYNSTGNSTNVNNLTPGATYRVMVCEYNGTPGVEQYKTDLATNNPASVTLTLQSTNLRFTNIQPTSMNVSWTRGSDEACIVFVAQTTSGNVSLANNTTYNADSNFGTGSSNGSGWYCVYKGTGNSVNISGLTSGLAYRVMVCEYNGTPGNETYNNSSATNNPANKTMSPSTQANSINISGIFVGKANISWTRGNGVSTAVFAKHTSSDLELASPENNINYIANSEFGNGSQIGSSGWYCIYKGTGTNVLLTNLTGGETYRIMVCEFNGITNGEQFNLNSATNNPKNFTTISSKTDQTITFNALAPRQYGSADFNPGATASSGLPITYTSSNHDVAIVVDGKIKIMGMGITIITASQEGDIDYTPAISVDQQFEVEKGTQGINFAPFAPKYFGDPDFEPGADASSGLPVTYSSNNHSVAIIVNNKIHIVGVGSTSISAFQNGDENFYPASSVFQNLVVTKKTQTIAFNPIPTKTFEDADFDPGATASSGLPVTYTSSNINVATIIGGRVRIVGAGSVNILASQEGNAYYSAASIVPRTLTISKADQTITFNSLSDIVYDDIYLDPAITTSGLDIEYISDDIDVAEIVFGKIHIVGAGTVNLTATQPGNDNYNPADEVTQSLTVTKKDQTITFNVLPSAIIGDPDITLTAESSSGLQVIYSSSNTSVATIVDGKIHIVGVGSANIIASQPGDNRYYPALFTVTQPFSVENADQLITFNSLPSKTFGDADFTLTASASSGLPVSFSSDNPSVATVTGNTVHIISAGTANITASQPGDGTYDRAPYVIQPLIINKRSQNITFDVLPAKTYGNPDFDLLASSTSGLPVSFVSDNSSVATIVNGKIHIVGAGTANIYAVQPGNSNYNAASAVFQPITVAKTTQSITFSPISSKTYSDADFSPSAVSTSGLPVSFSSSNENVAIVVGDKIHIVGLGTTTITAYQGGNSNFQPTSATRSFSVGKASQTITFSPISSRAYGSADFNLSATASSGLGIVYTSSNPSIATVTNGRVHIVGVGSTIISASQPGDSYYNSTLQTQIFIVTKANQTITFDAIPEQIYENGSYLLEALSNSGLPVTFTSNNTLVATVNYEWLNILGAGTVLITAMQPGNTFYNAASISQAVVVRKNTQTIYFDTIPEKIYGDVDFDPGAVSSSGLTVNYLSNNPQVATVVSGKIHIVGAGTAKITAYLNGNSNYYEATSVVKSLVVKKASVLVSADDKIRKFNTDNPTFTYIISGFVNGDDINSIHLKPSVSSPATKDSYPGSYDIEPQGGLDDNYTFTYQKGLLTVLGTSPLKPAKPTGNTILCINSDDQTYTTIGGVFATSYVWEMNPSSAGAITGTGVSALINFNDDFTGKVSISVKGKSLELSESSDTLHIIIIPKLAIPEVNCRGSYCDNSIFGDSIIIPHSPGLYKFQLYQDNNPYGPEIEGNGSRIGWYDLKIGTYAVTEKLCNLNVKDNMVIKEVSPNSSKPQVNIRWNDVLVCVKSQDSIIGYKWYKDGVLLNGENKQFLWTQQKAGNYTVKTTDLSGCDFTSDELFIEPLIKGLVYPNPNHGQFEISFNSAEKGTVTVKISSMKSLPVKTLSFTKDIEEFKEDVNIQGLTPGIYFVDVLLNGRRIFYEKIIVE
jgi:hypothetical protein